MSSPDADVLQTFWGHVDELRRRVAKAIVAFAVGAGCAWYFRQEVLLWLATPFVNAWTQTIAGKPAALHFPAPASLFLAYLRLSLIAGLIFSLPMILYQLWAFIARGIESRQRRYALPFVLSSTALFLLGGYFGWAIAFPRAFEYLLDFSGSVQTASVAIDVEPTVMVEDYIDFVSSMLLAFGAVFELPILVFFLALAGIINHVQMIGFSRYFVVLAFLLSAIITPPDIMSQFLLAVPLCLLYVVSIGIAWIVGKPRLPAT